VALGQDRLPEPMRLHLLPVLQRLAHNHRQLLPNSRNVPILLADHASDLLVLLAVDEGHPQLETADPVLESQLLLLAVAQQIVQEDLPLTGGQPQLLLEEADLALLGLQQGRLGLLA